MSGSRRRTLAMHEFRSQVRSAPFAALVLLLVAATSTLNPVAMIPGGSDVNLPIRAVANSVYALAPTFAMSGFFVYPFFAAVMAGLSVLRDDEVGMSELLHSTPLTRAEYVWMKMAGVVGALFIAVVLHILIVMAFREFAVGGVARGPFTLWGYLIAAGLFTAPGVLWMAGLAFVVGARSKAPMAVYALPVGLFVLEFVMLWNWHPRDISPTVDALLMVLDPTGLRWLTHSLFSTDRGIVTYNSAPLAVDRVLVISRLTTVMVPMLCLAWLARQGVRAERAARVAAAWRRVRSALKSHLATTTEVQTGAAGTSANRPLLAMRRRTPSTWRATTTVATSECRSLLRQPSIYLFMAFLFAVVAEVGGAEVDAYGSTAVLTAGGIGVNALPAVTVLTCLFLLFIIVESLHRDRATGFEAIAFSTPVPTTSFVLGKALAAIVLIAVFTVVCVLSGGTLLLTQSGLAASWWPLLLVFGAVLVPTYVLWTAFVTAVMSLVRSRTVALAIGFVALLLTAAQFIRGSMTWLTNWPLWGSLRWTEFAVFPLDGEALLWNRALALASAAALFGAARMVFVRTERDPVLTRARRTPAGVARLVLRTSPLLALPAFTGAFLAVRVHDAHDGPKAAQAMAAYEASHQQQLANATPAVIAHVDVDVGIEPAQRRVVIDGSYTMVNRSAQAMETLPFTVPMSFGRVQWSVDGRVVMPIRRAGLETLPLASPLPPQRSVRVSFQYAAMINAGFSRNGGPVDAFVIPSAVLLSTHRGDFLPVPGYHGKAGPTLRAVSDGPAAVEDKSRMSARSATATSDESGNVGYFNRGWAFSAVMRVRAPSGLSVNGVGQHTMEQREADETRSTWSTDVPVTALSLVGSKYAVRRRDGVAVYHHPAHTQSVDVMLSTLAAARRHYSAWFHPYPWPELRLSEYPDLSTQATSYPTNITFSEGLGFLTSAGEYGGLPFAVTAHEAAHQWWGHLLNAGSGPGTGMLVEGMADYATLLLYEAERGVEARRVFATLLERQYLDAREVASEQPLLATREDSPANEAVLQKKGAWAIWMLHNALGAERTFAGLRAFIAAHRAPGVFATPDAMLRALRQQASDTARFDANVTQWFRSTRLPSLSLEDGRCDAMASKRADRDPPDAAWACRVTVRNSGVGTATVDVAAQVLDSTLSGGLQRVLAEPGRAFVVRWQLQQRPDRFVIDPDVLVLQERRERGSLMLAPP